MPSGTRRHRQKFQPNHYAICGIRGAPRYTEPSDLRTPDSNPQDRTPGSGAVPGTRPEKLADRESLVSGTPAPVSPAEGPALKGLPNGFRLPFYRWFGRPFFP